MSSCFLLGKVYNVEKLRKVLDFVKTTLRRKGIALLLTMVMAFLCVSCSGSPSESSDLSETLSSSESGLDSSSQQSEGSTTDSSDASSVLSQSEEENGSGQNTSDPTTKPTDKPTAKPTAKPTEEPLKTVRVTIPEGYTVAQIAQTLEKNGVCGAKEFVSVSQSYSPKSFSVPSDSNRAFKMEGYLFPDTYEFYVDDDPQDVLIKLLNNYNAKAGGLSSQQLIVASIVEKESRSAENAALVASVIYNRLNAGMKLEMDPTRDYINNYVTNSPYLSSTGKYAALYNTYKCSGLPAGPICNPGSRAIQAALNPADSDYLYFFFGNDNQNHYSETYEEHQAAMEKYGVQYS